MKAPERSTLKAREAAAYLGVSYWLLLEMAKRGECRISGPGSWSCSERKPWMTGCASRSS